MPDPGYVGVDSFTFAAFDTSRPAYPIKPVVATVTLDVSGLDATVTVDNASAWIATGSGIDLDATVIGASSDVTWSVNRVGNGRDEVGAIDIDGRYSAPAVPPESGSVVVRAASTQAPAAYAEVVIAVVEPAFANGKPIIQGIPKVGRTLTASTSEISNPNGVNHTTYTYQWSRRDPVFQRVTDITGASSPSYVLTPDDLDSTISVSVSFTDDTGNAETLTSYWVPVLPASNSPAIGPPTISGTAQVGETLTANTTGIADRDGLSNVSYAYQWLADNGSRVTKIAGATRSSYIVQADDHGSVIQVLVSFADDAGNEEQVISDATAMVEFGQRAADSVPGAPGQPEATAVFIGGVDLEWDDVPGADAYDVQQYRNGQWVDLPSGGVEIAFYGAGAIISGLDPKSSLWFRVRAANAHGPSDWSSMIFMNATSQYRLGKRARPANLTATGAPVIQGLARVGETLWADTSGIEDGNGLDRVWYRYQWMYGDEADIAGATHLTYLVSEADEGGTIRVRVSFVDMAGYAESVISEAVETAAMPALVNSPATGGPRIDGTAQVGQTLTADTSGITDDDGLDNVAYAYQWLADDGDIAEATGSAYILQASDEGAVIKVRVSFTDDAANLELLTSTPTAVVTFAIQQQTVNARATGAPRIDGTAQVGEELTADTSGITDDDGLTNVSYSYQWLAGDADIAGATGSKYILVEADEGVTIKVRVSFTDDANNDESLTSVATDAVAAAEPAEPPAAPTGLNATPSHDRVVLRWDDPQDGSITGYVILRRNRATTEAGEFTVLEADTGSAATEYTDREVESEASYTYKVMAINGHGESELSLWARADTPATPAAPAAPTGLNATPSHDRVVLRWDDPQDGSITGYPQDGSITGRASSAAPTGLILRRNRASCGAPRRRASSPYWRPTRAARRPATPTRTWSPRRPTPTG